MTAKEDMKEGKKYRSTEDVNMEMVIDRSVPNIPNLMRLATGGAGITVTCRS